jgi:protein SCO1/2
VKGRNLIAVGAIVAAVLLAVAAGYLTMTKTTGGPQGAALVGGPFQLVDTEGEAVDQHVLDGKWSAVFFGFTYCPDFCPTTLQALAQAETQLGPKAKDFQTVFISVDPERDTPAQMKLYLSNADFPKHLIGLTGTKAQSDAAAKAYRVFHQKNGEGAAYLVDHSTITYLMNPKGRFTCVLPPGLTPEQTAERISKAMREGTRAESC